MLNKTQKQEEEKMLPVVIMKAWTFMQKKDELKVNSGRAGIFTHKGEILRNHRKRKKEILVLPSVIIND